ncbi:MAG: hypothetical protein DMD98_12100 [Candidatus Rokuibacteriota bacterium]|nr:MAG: hypothetical protein DMD98_12100 [Candidatus Rokubacteria bacterium]
MRYEMISADCHIDLCWLPPDLFTTNASAGLRDRMPYVTDGPKGPRWVTKTGAMLGLVNGMGSAGREYIPGQIHRSDRMASTGLYDDGKRGVRRLTDPELRLGDQDRDGVQAEVLYGILGTTRRLNDAEAAVEVMRVYNEWLADFCDAHPDRYAGLASIPNHPVEAAVEEVKRVAKRGGVRGLDVANSLDMAPLWDPLWTPLWDVVSDSRLPVHFHTVGGQRPDFDKLPPPLSRVAHAVHITGFQIHMATILMSLIFGGVLERYPTMRVVIGESGIGWTSSSGWTPNGRTSSRISASAARRASTGAGSARRPTRRIASASSCSTSLASTPSCGARTFPTPTGSGPTPARSSGMSWGICPPTSAGRSSARTRAGSTASSAERRSPTAAAWAGY